MNHDDFLPTTEDAAELANVMPQTLEEAYAEGRKDQKEESLSTIRDLVSALEAMMEGGVYKSIAGGEPDWHVIAMPKSEALEKARLAILAAKRPGESGANWRTGSWSGSGEGK